MPSKEIQLDKVVQHHYMYDQVEILGAREHNLKNIDVTFPRNKLVVITGLSGSGKSSLAFDTIYAEGQRRYIETFASYARSFIGELERPDVDKINGLSPVIAIEQKTTSKNPRSTVGTVTEIYDYLRLLFAKVADAYSYASGHKMVKQTEQQIENHLLREFVGKKISLLAPVVKGRKGHYRELFQQISSMGFSKVRIDGEIKDLTSKMQVDRYKIHDIEIVIDRIFVDIEDIQRLRNSLHITLQHGKGVAMLQESNGKIHYFSKSFMDPVTGLSYDEPAPNTFSFNSPYGACPICEGLGIISEVDLDAIIPDKKLSIRQGAILPIGPESNTGIFKLIKELFKYYQVELDTPVQDLPQRLLDTILYGPKEINESESSVHEQEGVLKFEGIIAFLTTESDKLSAKERSTQESYKREVICPECNGARLKKVSLYFKIADKNIAELANMNLRQLYAFLEELMPKLDQRQQLIAAELLKEIKKRLNFLLDVGLYYLSLNRPLKTLSGGEAQRIRLATQIGTQLVGVLYILDEPSIGLHQRDNVRLIQALKDLRDLGNSVMVVEHDKDMMLHADYILDIGPGAGKNGGRVVAAGTPSAFLKQDSMTAEFLAGKRRIAVPTERRKGNGQFLTLSGCTGNNLRNVTLNLPLGKLICITGVSGSGKSTLIHQTLYPILQKYLYKSSVIPLPYTSIEGLKNLDKVVEIDQKPIGRTPRSNPSTYTNVFSSIRNLFTQLPEAKIRGYQPGRFSFNVSGGRCETCQGGGMRVIEMDFLPDVYVHCETCQGKRYNRETLEVQYKGKSISDVLDMTISNAVEFFDKYPSIRKIIQILEEVGLGYLTLGQPATTLSGGEAQRVKLATELAKRDTGKTLYILDEPTTGLHFQDIQHLLDVLNKLTDKGNTVLIIEHNLDIIKVADYIIDMGPEGGEQGGQIIAQGTPEEIANYPDSYTAKFLKMELQN
ncbi:MAG: excinuclease ABC subunit A [Candidatus Amoebophilus sp. 36-38]|nr:MAG: excinuclease ABC subunit A [Candidatus Amoebophilus sp. 36-38]